MKHFMTKDCISVLMVITYKKRTTPSLITVYLFYKEAGNIPITCKQGTFIVEDFSLGHCLSKDRKKFYE